MKNVNNNLVMLVMVMTTFLSFANPKLGIENANPFSDKTRLKVEFKNVKEGNIVRIKDDHGNEIYSEEIAADGIYEKALDLSRLENGNYNIELEKDFEIIVSTFQVKNNKVIFLDKNDKKIFKPVIRNENDLLLVSKISFDSEPYRLKIYYDNEVIYSETLEKNELINKVYRLQKEIKGSYKVVMYNNKRNYHYNFKM